MTSTFLENFSIVSIIYHNARIIANNTDKDKDNACCAAAPP